MGCDGMGCDVTQDLLAMMEAEDASREDGTSIAGTLVRLAWHASGTYSKVNTPMYLAEMETYCCCCCRWWWWCVFAGVDV